MATLIEISDLNKRFGGRTAVKDLSLTVEEGDIYGFVGPNGAGKTTAIRIMAGLLEPTDGDVLIGGHSVRTSARAVRKQIGYMPDFFGVYEDMLVWEYLDFFGACYDIPQMQRAALTEDLLELVDLSHRRDDPVEKLSRGMKQRLSLARTLIHDPRALILDEPASGLDPRARSEIRALLVELSKLGKTIFFSTHILADVAEICNRVGIIEAGELVAAGDLEELQQQLMPARQIRVVVLGQASTASGILEKTPGVSSLERRESGEDGIRSTLVFEFSGEDGALAEILSDLLNAGVPVLNFSEDHRNMEGVFLRATKGLVT